MPIVHPVCEQENSVAFSPVDEDQGVKMSQSQAAKLLPPKRWMSAATSIAWHLRPTLNGMQPVRPVCVAVQDLTLPDQKVLVLQNST